MVSQFYIPVFALLFVKVNTFRGESKTVYQSCCVWAYEITLAHNVLLIVQDTIVTEMEEQT